MLRGAEVHAFDVIFEVLTSRQWAELLKAPLERAAVKGKRGLAQKLVGAGADVGDSLHAAVGGGHVDIVSDLLESGASTAAKDGSGDTPLHVAVEHGEAEMVQLLLLKGADKDSFDSHGMTPLYLAAEEGHIAPALALLAAGADMSLPCGRMRTLAIHAAAAQGHVEILKAVIEHGADLEALDDEKETALHQAAWHGHTDAIDVLVEAGANVEARNWLGGTPLHNASDGLSREGLKKVMSGTHQADTGRCTRGCGKLARSEMSRDETVGGSTVDRSNDCDWAVVVAKVLQLPEEGIFRTIVGFL
eukprot:g14622.t1